MRRKAGALTVAVQLGRSSISTLRLAGMGVAAPDAGAAPMSPNEGVKPLPRWVCRRRWRARATVQAEILALLRDDRLRRLDAPDGTTAALVPYATVSFAVAW